jgi:hypothetical protein
MTVRLQFDSFDLESCNDCSCDNVKIYDGQDDTAVLLIKKCANPGHDLFYSSGQNMLVVFKSDLKNPRRGFSARYLAVPANRGNWVGLEM